MSRLIDADALVWVLKHSKTYYKVIALDVVLDAVRCSPTIDAVEVVRGEWKNHKDEHYCTNCGEVVIGDWYDTDDWYDFCPWCGAKMKGADDEV